MSDTMRYQAELDAQQTQSQLGMMLSQVSMGMQSTANFGMQSLAATGNALQTGMAYGMGGLQGAYGSLAYGYESAQALRQQSMQLHAEQLSQVTAGAEQAASMWHDPTKNFMSRAMGTGMSFGATVAGWGAVGKLPMFSVGRMAGKGLSGMLGFGTTGLAAGGLGLLGGLAGMMLPFMAVDHTIDAIMQEAGEREKIADAIGSYSQRFANPLSRSGTGSHFGRDARYSLARDIQATARGFDHEDFGQGKIGMAGITSILDGFAGEFFRDPTTSPDKFREHFKSKVKMIRDFAMAFDKSIEESVQLVKQIQGMTGDLYGRQDPRATASLLGRVGNIAGLDTTGMMGVASQGSQMFLAAGLSAGAGVNTAAVNLGNMATMRHMGLISNNDFMRIGGAQGAAQMQTQSMAQMMSGPIGQMLAAAALRGDGKTLDPSVINNIISGRISATQAVGMASQIAQGGVQSLSNFYANSDKLIQQISPVQIQGLYGSMAIGMLQSAGMEVNQTNLATAFQSNFGMSQPMARTLASQITNPEIFARQQQAAVNQVLTKINQNEMAQNTFGNWMYRNTLEAPMGAMGRFFHNYLVDPGANFVGGATRSGGKWWSGVKNSYTGNIDLEAGSNNLVDIFGLRGAGVSTAGPGGLSGAVLSKNAARIASIFGGMQDARMTGLAADSAFTAGAHIRAGGGAEAIADYENRSTAELVKAGYSVQEAQVLLGHRPYEASDGPQNINLTATQNLLRARESMLTNIAAGARMSLPEIEKTGILKNAQFLRIASDISRRGSGKLTVQDLVGAIREGKAEGTFGFKAGQRADNLSPEDARRLGALAAYAGKEVDLRDENRLNEGAMVGLVRQKAREAAVEKLAGFYEDNGYIFTSTMGGQIGEDIYGFGFTRYMRGAGTEMQRDGMEAMALLADKDLSGNKTGRLRDLLARFERTRMGLPKEQQAALTPLLADMRNRLEGRETHFSIKNKEMAARGLGIQADSLRELVRDYDTSASNEAVEKTFLRYGWRVSQEIEAANKAGQLDFIKSRKGWGKTASSQIADLAAKFKSFGDGNSDVTLESLMKMVSSGKYDDTLKRVGAMGGVYGRIAALTQTLKAISTGVGGGDLFEGATKDVELQQYIGPAADKWRQHALSSDKVAREQYAGLLDTLSKKAAYKGDVGKIRPILDKISDPKKKLAATLALLRNTKGDANTLALATVLNEVGADGGGQTVAGTHAGQVSKVNEKMIQVLNQQLQSMEQHRAVMETLYHRIQSRK